MSKFKSGDKVKSKYGEQWDRYSSILTETMKTELRKNKFTLTIKEICISEVIFVAVEARWRWWNTRDFFLVEKEDKMSKYELSCNHPIVPLYDIISKLDPNCKEAQKEVIDFLKDYFVLHGLEDTISIHHENVEDLIMNHPKRLNFFIKNGWIVKKTPKYKVGDCFILDWVGAKRYLAVVGPNKVQLVGLDSSGYNGDRVDVEDINDITEKEFTKICGGLRYSKTDSGV